MQVFREQIDYLFYNLKIIPTEHHTQDIEDKIDGRKIFDQPVKIDLKTYDCYLISFHHIINSRR